MRPGPLRFWIAVHDLGRGRVAAGVGGQSGCDVRHVLVGHLIGTMEVRWVGTRGLWERRGTCRLAWQVVLATLPLVPHLATAPARSSIPGRPAARCWPPPCPCAHTNSLSPDRPLDTHGPLVALWAPAPRSAGCTLLAAADRNIFQVGVESVAYDGPLKLKVGRGRGRG